VKRSLGTRLEIDRALTELGRQLARLDAGEIRILCGGASGLCMLEILSRSTLDVDALGLLGKGGSLLRIRRFPAEFRTAVERTAEVMGLDGDWFNAQAGALLELGLPKGVVARSRKHRRSYGPCLTVQFLARIDQAALKLFAAMDPKNGQRHFKDLVEIKPTGREMNHAIRWMLGWKTSPAFRRKLAEILQAIGFPRQSRSVSAFQPRK